MPSFKEFIRDINFNTQKLNAKISIINYNNNPPTLTVTIRDIFVRDEFFDTANLDYHAFINDNYGGILFASTHDEFNKMVESAKKIFPSLKKGKKGAPYCPESKFVPHILALYSDVPVEIPNEDVIIL